jgi:hypothetical protein
MSNDVYFQIGLLTTLGLTTKNAILIVQFAKARVEEGMGMLESTLEAAKLRFRPIIMTSLAFGIGVMPMRSQTGRLGRAEGDRHRRGRRRCDLHAAGDAVRAALLRDDREDVRRARQAGSGQASGVVSGERRT